MSHAKNHHYVPACYLKHFATPPRRRGALFEYDRVTGQSSRRSPHEVARQMHFYTVEVEGKSPALAEDTYGKLESRFAPTLTAVVERGVLPTDPTEMRELLAFVATQTLRTPRVRAKQQRFYSDVHMMVLRVVATNKAAFMKALREMEDEELRNLSDDEADQLFADLGERVNAPDTRVEISQTRLVGDAFEVSAEIEDVLARRHWILGVAPDDAQFITSDDPVRLDWAMLSGREPPPGWSPGFADPNANVLVTLSPRLMLIGVSYKHDRARVRFNRDNVAGFNTDTALAATRYVFSVAPTFVQMTRERTVVEGPSELLRKVEPTPTE